MFLCWQKIKVSLASPSPEGFKVMGIGCFKQVSAAEKTEVAGNVNNVAS